MTHPIADAPAPPEVVAPLVRGLAVLRELTRAHGRQSVADLVRGTALARATVDRILSTLAHLGYVRLRGRDVSLTPVLMELGNAYLASCRLPDVLGPLADRLADELDESVCLAIPDRDGVRFVHQTTRQRAMSLAFRIGGFAHAEHGAPGALFAVDWAETDWARWRRRDTDPGGHRAAPAGTTDGALSFEERIAVARRHGWSLDDQLVEPGLLALAVPVHDTAGRCVCAVSVVSHTGRHSAASLRETVLPRLRGTAAAMEDKLHTAPPGPADATTAPPVGGPEGEPGPEFVESLARGLRTITAFGRGGAELPLNAVAEATGLARATARRSLITLEHLGYVSSAGRLFRLTPRVLDLGFAHLSTLTLAQIAEPHLASLVEVVNDSASMAILAGDDIQYAARVPTVRIMNVNITVGTRFPAYATSMGRVLLADRPPADRAAYLDRVILEPFTRHTVTSTERLDAILLRVDQDGFALVEDELEEGLRSVAMPVRDRAGAVVGAVNVSMHVRRRTVRETLDTVLPALGATTTRIESDLWAAGRYAPIPIA